MEREKLPGSQANLFTDFLSTDDYCFEMYYILTGKGTQLSVYVIDEENSEDTLVSTWPDSCVCVTYVTTFTVWNLC